MRQHLGGRGDGGEVVAAVPASELLEQAQHRRGLLGFERHAKARRAFDELLRSAHAPAPIFTTVRPVTVPSR